METNGTKKTIKQWNKNLMEQYFALKISFLIRQRPENSVLKVS